MPPDQDDLAWMFERFDAPEIYRMFGFSEPARTRITERHATGKLIVGIIRLVSDRSRIGFMIMFPPSRRFDFWELSFAIPEPRQRNCFDAVDAMDAMLHYMFEYRRASAIGWRIREDNRPVDAIIRWLGYQPFATWLAGDLNYTFYRLDEAGWAERRARLDRGEQAHPFVPLTRSGGR